MSDIRRCGSNSPYEDRYGYSRAVVAGDLTFVAGTTGADPATCEFPDDAAAQTRLALANIERALNKAGGRMADLLQHTTYCVHEEDWDAISAGLATALRDIRPVNAAIRTGLIHADMRVEIAAPALRR